MNKILQAIHILAKRYYHGLYEKLLEIRGSISLCCGRIFWDAHIDNSVIAHGKVDIVNDWHEGVIVIGKDTVLNSNSHRCGSTSLYRPVKIRTHFVGGAVYIADNVILNGTSIVARSKKIEIGEGTNIAPNCIIMDSDFHDAWPSKGRFERPGIENDQDVIIGRNVWICTGCILLKGTVIGDNSIIAAGSVVNSVIPSGVVAGGVPARVLKIVEC